MRFTLLLFNVVLCLAYVRAEGAKPLYTKDEISPIFANDSSILLRLLFPKESFLATGYAPPGGYVKDFSVFKRGGRYHLFHIDGRGSERCTDSGNEISFGHASSTDLQHWSRHRMPVAVGDKPWDNERVWARFVTGWNGRFYMFYMASGRHTDGVLASASSDDLETWTKSEEPIRLRDATPSYGSTAIRLFHRQHRRRHQQRHEKVEQG